MKITNWLCASVLIGLTVGCQSQPDSACEPMSDARNPAPCMVALAPTTAPAGSVSEDQKQLLLMMRREEKLAHDVYVTLGRQYNLMPLRNIPRSELQHQQVMASLLARYGVADPVANLPEGKFDRPEVQALFDQLVKKGLASEIDALKVGAEIEELDIRDLRHTANICTQTDIRQACAGLEGASGNHLRAFVRNLSARGGAYAAQHLSRADFDQIAMMKR